MGREGLGEGRAREGRVGDGGEEDGEVVSKSGKSGGKTERRWNRVRRKRGGGEGRKRVSI